MDDFVILHRFLDTRSSVGEVPTVARTTPSLNCEPPDPATVPPPRRGFGGRL